MMQRLSKSLSKWLIKCDVIDNADRELYEYAVYCLFISISPIIITSILGLIMGKLSESIILIIPFMTIRKYSGGYHAKSFRACLIISTCLMAICISMTSFIKCGMVLDIITLCAIGSLTLFSPIDHENRRLDEYEKKKYKKTAGIIAILFGIIYLALILFQINKYAICISMGLIISAGLQFPCVIFKRKN